MKRPLIAVALATVVPTFAQSASISAVEVISVQQEFGSAATIARASESVNDGTATASLSFGETAAEQNADGTSEVQAETTREASTQLNTASAEFTQSEMNTFGMDRDYTLSYSLSGMSARLNHFSDTGFFGPIVTPVFNNPFTDDFETLVDSNYTAASFRYSISVNGNEVFSARSDALLSTLEADIQNETGFNATLTDVGSGFGRQFLFEVDDISGEIDLGTFAAGETISVTSTLIAQGYAQNILDELGNNVGSRSTDPVNLSSTGFLTSTPTSGPSPVPLPATGWMLIAAVGGMTALRRSARV